MASREQKIADEAPFEVPPFEEKEFIRKELISFKTTVVLFFFTVVTAGISYFIWKNAELAFFLHIVIALAIAFGLLRFIFKAVKIDIGHWKRKEWTGTYFLYFFFWLGFFLLFTNPPITDAAPPFVEVGVSPAVQSAGEPVHLGAYVADNAGLQRDTLEFCIRAANGSGECGPAWQRVDGDPVWATTFTAPEPGEYTWSVSVVDQAGLRSEQTGTITIGDPFRVVEPPRDNEFVVSSDALRVRVAEDLNVRVVQFRLDDDQTWSNFARDPDPAKAADGWWTTDPSYEGWTVGPHQVHVRAVEQPAFLSNGHTLGPAVIPDPDGPYNVTVTDRFPLVGETDPPTFEENRFVHPGQTPGLGGLAAVGAVAGTALAFGRRRRHA